MTSVRTKLANILRNFHRNSPHPEADTGDVEAAMDAILNAADDVHPVVVGMDFANGDSTSYTAMWMSLEQYHQMLRHRDDLLEANNRYLNRARAAEAGERAARDARQVAMTAWAKKTFGDIDGCDPLDLVERARCFLEEAIELAQSCGLDAVTASKLLSRSYSALPGSPQKELGQAQMTLSILAEVLEMSACEREIAEFDRVQKKSKAHFEARHRAKMEVGL